MACGYSFSTLKPHFEEPSARFRAQLSPSNLYYNTHHPAKMTKQKLRLHSILSILHLGFNDLKSAKSTWTLWRQSYPAKNSLLQPRNLQDRVWCSTQLPDILRAKICWTLLPTSAGKVQAPRLQVPQCLQHSPRHIQSR